MNSRWKRVSRARRCPICGKGDWCLFVGPDDDPESVICARVESARRAGDAGWVHRLRDRDGWTPNRRRVVTIVVPDQAPDLGALVADSVRYLDPLRLVELADQLGVMIDSLRRLGVGWSIPHQAFTFPMRDARGNVTGIRLRYPNGRKLSVKGGREGLFIPEGMGGVELLLVCEGPTDTAALAGLGFDVVGRPSCSGGTRHLVELLRCWTRAHVVIVADQDEPGRLGAERLASALIVYSPSVRVICPPAGAKDARAWVQLGATAEDVQRTINQTTEQRLTVAARR